MDFSLKKFRTKIEIKCKSKFNCKIKFCLLANEFYNKQVVGLEANSSKQATSNSETQVNIANGNS
ncbi:hypothetical protein KSU07_00290 [Fusobacterium animalis]